jgi:hypothetical protein
MRALAYQELGRTAEAGEQYRLALSQWKTPDPSFQPLVDEIEAELAAMGRPG